MKQKRKKGRNPFANMTKAERIASLEKALANRKTPAVFRPSLRKRLAALKGR
jgi:hypothetical protein